MAFFKFGAFIFALFVLQAQSHTQPKTADASLVDIVREIVSGAEAAVDSGLDFILTQIQNAESIFGANQGDRDDMLNKIILPLVDSILSIADSELNKLEKVVNDDAKAFLVCLVENKDYYKTTLWKLLTYNTGCFTYNFGSIFYALNTTVLDIKSLQVDLKATASQGIDNCDGKSDAEAVGCLFNVLKEVIDVATNIPDGLSADIENLKKLHGDYLRYLPQCVGYQADVFVDSISEALNHTVTCYRKS